MSKPLPLDAVDAGLILKAYAVAVGLAGLLLSVWGLHLLPAGALAGVPWGGDLIRVIGSIASLAAVLGYGLSRVESAYERRRLLGYFVAVHTGALLIFFWPSLGIWGVEFRREFLWLGYLIAAAWMWLLVGWTSAATGDPPPLKGYVSRLFGTPEPSLTERLRSDYENQMRRAGAQEERNRLARDLHDSVKQQIFAIQTAAATAEARLAADPQGARSAIAQVRDAARDSMSAMDAMLDQLRVAAMENTGLVEALKRQCEALRIRTGANVTCEIGRLPAASALPPGAHLAIIRATQEGLSNVARHARASNVRVCLGLAGGRLELTVRDDGSGYDVASVRPGLGLESIRARAAEFGGEAHIGSKPDAGTMVFFTLPLAVEDPKHYRGKAVFSLAAVALLTGLVVARPRGMTPLLFLPVAFNAARYTLAWRRAVRLRSAAS